MHSQVRRWRKREADSERTLGQLAERRIERQYQAPEEFAQIETILASAVAGISIGPNRASRQKRIEGWRVIRQKCIFLLYRCPLIRHIMNLLVVSDRRL